ncbi:Rieske (2Fe-2S) protein [Jiella avicenniae]|uniref:Rieske (2Fe-2S) protein n=1 Tax=Jiella avicenniae TaxID=2907202 RepID=A0A9X1NXU1_9HYPH|nr:Rieske (2Fe-2S) protein [Jiella avicenniae]MCE7027705.1 Rieske (2Fe-2S) protein [Jiella avicenniae]MCE7028747.1 Rieske (2Fe-2S) protein [Jiella avicenniae]
MGLTGEEGRPGEAPRWHPLFPASELADGALRPAAVAGHVVVVVRDGARFYAFQRACPHEGADLSEGWCAAGRLHCPRHQASFDLSSGAVAAGWSFAPPKTYPLEVRGGVVFIAIPSARPAP